VELVRAGFELLAVQLEGRRTVGAVVGRDDPTRVDPVAEPGRPASAVLVAHVDRCGLSGSYKPDNHVTIEKH
jgi:hypothetical protein